MKQIIRSSVALLIALGTLGWDIKPVHATLAVPVALRSVQSLTDATVVSARSPLTKKSVKKRHWRYKPSYMAFGNCTRFAAEYLGGTNWTGNGGSWYQNAAAAGYKVGKTPKKGSVIVTSEGYGTGHVGIVIAVNIEKRTFMIRERNYKGFNITSNRILPFNFKMLIGFIYV